MEKFNQAPVPAKVESEPIDSGIENDGSIQASDTVETSKNFVAPSEASLNDVPLSPESAPESSGEKITRLREQKNNASERLNSEFWPDELDDVSTYRIRNILAKAQGKEQAEDDFKPSSRGMQAVEVQKQIETIDSQIDQMYDENPDLVESRLKEIIDSNLDASRLSYFKSIIEESRSIGVGPGGISIYDREFTSLLSKFEKHRGYDKSKDIDTPETWSPKYDFVEGYVAQLIQERADEVVAYEALSPEVKERYPDKQTVRKKLSYQDADLPPEQLEAMLRDAEGRDTAEQYAHHLNKLPQEEVERVLPQIKGLTKKVLSTIGIPNSSYGKSDSWAYWDLGKQQYYYEQNKRSEPEEGNPYTYAPALEKLDEISDRHVGWEFYHAPAEVRENAFKSIKDPYYLARVFEVIQNDPKADGQLPSHEYAELGKILREYARSEEFEDNIDDRLAVQHEVNDKGVEASSVGVNNETLSESELTTLERENAEKIKEALDQVEFDVLKDIFYEILNRYGINIDTPDSIHVRKFIDRDEVRPNLTGDARVEAAKSIAITKEEIVNRPDQEFSTIEPVIEFNPLSRAFREELQAPDESFPVLQTVLKCIIHEEVHATQFSGKVEVPNADGSRLTVKGITEQFSTIRESDTGDIDMETGEKSHTLLNEGLVEVIADDVTNEYLKRTGNTEMIGTYYQAYPVGRIMLELLLYKISEATGSSREIILDELTGISYKGASLLQGEFNEKVSKDARSFLREYHDLSPELPNYEEKVGKLCGEFVQTIDIKDVEDQAILTFLQKRGTIPKNKA